jgi:excisionase family DNA binding protein
MTNLLTAKEMQTLLQVDRSTIYRMAEAGRLPAIKVGKQWRFPGALVENWLATQATNPTAAAPVTSAPPAASAFNNDFASLLPVQCVQLIQDTFADALGVMLVIADIEGRPVTQVSHPCGLFNLINQNPGALQKCIDSWYQLGQAIELEPKFTPSHLGLLCGRALVRVGLELKGMVIVGGIAPDNWPPPPNEVQAIAAEFGLSPEALTPHLNEVFYLGVAERARALLFIQRIADVMAHIVNERNTLMEKLTTIAKRSVQ